MLEHFVVLGMLADFQFIVQLFILVSIASFVLNHLGKGPLSIVVIGVLAYLVFVMIPWLAEGVFIIYILLMAGISTVIVDFFFLSANVGPQQEQVQGPSGTDVRNRMASMQKAHPKPAPGMRGPGR